MGKHLVQCRAWIARLFVVAMTLTSCGGEKRSDGLVVLRYSLWGTPAVVEIHQALTDMFEEKNPTVKVRIEVVGWGSYWDKLQIQLASNTAPDVYWMSGAYYHNFAREGVFLNLAPLMKRDSIDLSDYFLEKDIFENPDTIYGFPKDLTTVVLYYNKTLFARENVEYPNEEWTWNDFVAAAKKLTKDLNGDGKPDQWGTAPFMPFVEEYVGPTVFSNGGMVLSHDKSRCLIDRPEAVEAIQFMVDLINKHRVSPGIGQIVSVGGDAFSTGQAAMIQNISALYHLGYARITDFEWDIAPIPKSPRTNRRVTTSGSLVHVVNAQTKHPEESWKLVKFLSSETAQRMLGGNKVFAPAHRRIAHEVFALPPPDNVAEILRAYDYSHGLQFTKNWLEWTTAIQRELEPAFLGKKSVGDACRAAARAVDRILEKQ